MPDPNEPNPPVPSIFNPSEPQIVIRLEPGLLAGQPGRLSYEIGDTPLLTAICMMQDAQTDLLHRYHDGLQEKSARQQADVIDPRRN